MATRRVVPFEDGSTGQASVITTRTRLYKDVDLSFEAKPGPGNGQKGDIYKKFDTGAVLQALRSIVLTGRGEKPFEPLFGAGVNSELFELNDVTTYGRLSKLIKDSIVLWEPRVSVMSINIFPDEEKYHVGIEVTVKVKNTQDVVTFTTYFNRLR